jgi:hypothetical protein
MITVKQINSDCIRQNEYGQSNNASTVFGNQIWKRWMEISMSGGGGNKYL